MGGAPLLIHALPLATRSSAPLPHLPDVGQDFVLHDEAPTRVEAQQGLGGGDFLVTERRAMGLAGVLLRRGGPADDRTQHDHGRPRSVLLGGRDRRREGVDVLDIGAGVREVDSLHLPSVRGVARGDILAERDLGVVLDRDVVGVVEDDQVAQFLVTGERTRLRCDSFHEVAVRGDDVHVMVERALTRRGVGIQQPALAPCRQRHPHRGGQPLAQGARGDLHPRVWRYSGCPGVAEPQVRSCLRSCSSSPYPLRYNWMYRVRLECPQESTNRSRPSHWSSAGSWRITCWNSR